MLLSTAKKRVDVTEYLTHEILLDEVVNGYNELLKTIVARKK